LGVGLVENYWFRFLIERYTNLTFIIDYDIKIHKTKIDPSLLKIALAGKLKADDYFVGEISLGYYVWVNLSNVYVSSSNSITFALFIF
jgi:hypothetical protein